MLRPKGLLPLLLVLVVLAACGSGQRCSGTEVIFRAIPQRGQQVTPAGMQLAQQIMSRRLDTLGVSSPTVSIRGSDELVVEFSGTDAPKNVAAIIDKTGRLEFYDFEADLAPPTVQRDRPTPYPSLYSLLRAVRSEARHGAPAAYYLFKDPAHPVQGPAPTLKALLQQYHGKQPHGTTVFAVPANREVVEGPASTDSTQPVGKSSNGRYWYLFRYYPARQAGPPEVTGEDLVESAIQADVGQDGQPEVLLGLDRHGGREFQAITKAEFDRGKQLAELHGSATKLNQLYTQHNAIVLDGQLEATPYIDYTDNVLSRGIGPGGGLVISDLGTMQAARRLALVLSSGSLPYTFQEVSRSSCPPG